MISFLKGKILFLISIFALYSYQINDSLVDDVLVGKYKPETIQNFQIVPKKYSLRQPIYINHETLNAFISLAEAARKEGFSIFILSGVRNFSAQKAIWEGKFNGIRAVEGMNLKKTIGNEKTRALKILEYSSMPGTSRHHWGTDIDIGFDIRKADKMLTNTIYKSGEGKRFYNWMSENALKYGFCQPYKDNPRERNRNMEYGYQEESWHWSYKPVAREYLKLYQKNSHKFKPSGFDGSSASGSFYMDYVQNIHKDCY